MYASVALAVPDTELTRKVDKMIDLWLQVATPKQQRTYYLNILTELRKEKVINAPNNLAHLSSEQIMAYLAQLPTELKTATTLAEYARRLSIAGRTPRMVWLELGGLEDFSNRVDAGEIQWDPAKVN